MPSIPYSPNDTLRFRALDGLRGLAAASVVLLHLLSVFLGTSFSRFRGVELAVQVLERTPLRAIWGGAQAVTLFFIISGFALHRMLSAQPMHYVAFAARRIVRLWIPYFTVIVLSIIGIDLVGTHRILGQSAWLNSLLGTVPSERLFFQHMMAIGVFDTKPINFVIWSLVQEFRLSLLFPIIFWVVNRYKATLVLILSFALSLTATLAQALASDSQVSPVSSVGVQFLFVLGAVISRYESDLRRYYLKTPKFLRALLFTLAVVLYSNCLRVSSTYGPVFGAALIVFFALSSQVTVNVLSQRPIQWLGTISYSLYLCHAVLLLLLINLAYPRFSFLEIVAVAGPLSLITATALYQWIERPAIKISRMLGHRLQLTFPAQSESLT